VDLSIENSEAAKLHAWFNEWEPINKNAMRQSDLFSLYSEFDKTSCAPDAGFLVENRTGALKSKPGGYNRMFELQRHLKHFPASTVPGFSILFVTTTEHRRDELVKSSAQFDPHRLWKFACRNDINADTFFFGSVWRAADKTAHALITQ
jgi:hypothetical protein